MNREYLATLAIAVQAAEWLERLPTASAREGEAFLHWFRQSPTHAHEFFLAVRTAERLKHLDSQRLLNVQTFMALATQNVAPLTAPIPSDVMPQRSEARRRRIGRRWTVAAAIGFLAILIIVTATLRAVSGDSISTAGSESQTVPLADGTIVRAGPRTHATVAFTKHDRTVRLLQGEIMIYVAKDSSRPFYVETELATARALGTAFAVRRFDSERVVVTVQEGRVAVTRESQHADRDQLRSAVSANVSAGEQVRVTPEAVPLLVRPVDLDKELAWVTGSLRFTTETLGDAVREFNLRNETQIKVLSPQDERRSVRGIFEATEPRTFALFIAASANLTLVEDRSDTLLLVPTLALDAPALSDPGSH